MKFYSTSSWKLKLHSMKLGLVAMVGFVWVFILIGLVVRVRVLTYSPGDLGSITGRVIPKTLKMVLDTALLNTQQYKVRIKGKVKQSMEKSSALPYTSV